MLESIIFLLHTKHYYPEAVTTMLWTYEINSLSEQLNSIKLDNNGITSMETFNITKMGNTL